MSARAVKRMKRVVSREASRQFKGMSDELRQEVINIFMLRLETAKLSYKLRFAFKMFFNRTKQRLKKQRSQK